MDFIDIVDTTLILFRDTGWGRVKEIVSYLLYFDLNLKKRVRVPILSNLDLIDSVSLVRGAGDLIDLFGQQGELHSMVG